MKKFLNDDLKELTKLFLQTSAYKPPSTHLSATLPFLIGNPGYSQKKVRFQNTLLCSLLFSQVIYYRDLAGLTVKPADSAGVDRGRKGSCLETKLKEGQRVGLWL